MKRVLRRVLRRGSENFKGVSRRWLERFLGEYDPSGLCRTQQNRMSQGVENHGSRIGVPLAWFSRVKILNQLGGLKSAANKNRKDPEGKNARG